MNFLAHAYLSGDNTKIMVGNFIGDFVKGKQALESFEPEIIKGIELHRTIDEFTDKHPVVLQSKNRLRPKYRHYAAVIVDVFYDHFLASNWHLYHHQHLPEFVSHVYGTVKEYDAILPQGMKYMLPYMISGNWLVKYGTIEGIQRTLTGMANRTPYVSKMDESVNDLKEHYDLFKAEFTEFFPALAAASKKWLAEN